MSNMQNKYNIVKYEEYETPNFNILNYDKIFNNMNPSVFDVKLLKITTRNAEHNFLFSYVKS